MGFSMACSPFRRMFPLVTPFALACLLLCPCSGVSCSCMGVSWYAFTCASSSLSSISCSSSSYCPFLNMFSQRLCMIWLATMLRHGGLVFPVAQLAGPGWDRHWAVPDVLPHRALCSPTPPPPPTLPNTYALKQLFITCWIICRSTKKFHGSLSASAHGVTCSSKET